MATPFDGYLAKLCRTLSPTDKPGVEYPVVAINEPYVGHTLDRCKVLERVGAGAMSVVYKAKQEFTDRIVAIKMLRSQLCCDKSNVKRFQREAKAIARLSHTNLLNVYSVGNTKTGQPYIVMDYVEGKSLTQVIEKDGQVEWNRCASIFMQVCDAMQHAHANRIIHRDLKPDNIMLVDNPKGVDIVKVVDFGIVKITDESQALSQKLTQAGEVWGSPVYMSPEQCMGHELDVRSDIYSLGTVLYEALMGTQLFEGKRITDIVTKQLNEKPQPFKERRPDLNIPLWFEDLTRKALEKEPRNRFNSMEEFKRAIEKGMFTRKDTAQVMKSAAEEALKAANKSAHAAPAPAPKAAAAAAPITLRPIGAGGPDPFVGLVIGGKYHVKSLIGEGGMSVVYKAVQEGIHRSVAIKFLREELCSEESNVKRFKRESKSVSQLSHPNLVAIYDVGVAEQTDQPYMVMEYLEGVSLMDEIDKKGPMPAERALPIFIQICDVMNYAHNKGYIHRDLKPHNIMLVKAGEKPDFAKLVDFGIVAVDAELQAVSQKLTAAGEICGSPIYMSPEQVLDEPVDGRSDVYALGVMMYECLAGRPPFGGKRITDVMQKHIHTSPPPFSSSAPDVVIDPALEGVIFKTLEKRPENRMQSMDALKKALLSVANRGDSRPGSASLGYASSGISSLPPPVVPPAVVPAVETPVKTSSGPIPAKVVMILLAVIVGAVVTGGAFMIFGHHDTPTTPADEKQESVHNGRNGLNSSTEKHPDRKTNSVSGSDSGSSEGQSSVHVSSADEKSGNTGSADVQVRTPGKNEPPVVIEPVAKKPIAQPHPHKRRPRESMVDVMNATENANLRPHADKYSF